MIFHCIIDNSNVFIGSQNIRNQKTQLIQTNPAIRVNVKNLAKVLEAGKLQTDIKTRIVGGSIPPENARVWKEWESCGYKCILGDRSAKGQVSRMLDNDHVKMNFPFFLGNLRGHYVTRSNLRYPPRFLRYSNWNTSSCFGYWRWKYKLW
jgi:hypothetical protein